MVIKDFRKLVLSNPRQDSLNSLEVTIEYPYLNSKIELKGIQNIYKFVYDQVIGWNNIENLPPYFFFSKTHFEELKSSIIDFIVSNYELNPSQFEYKWDIIKANLTYNNNSYDEDYVLIYDSSETDFLISIYKKNTSYFDSAVVYLLNIEKRNEKKSDYYTGLLMAYEFRSQKDSEILHRRNNEKKSLSQIRDKYNEYIVEGEQQLNGYLSDAKENLTEHFETVEKLKEEKNKNFDIWFKDTDNKFDNFYSLAQESIINNEELYREKLRLEAPAKYWKDRAIKLKNESDDYLNWLIKTSIYGALILFIILIALGNNFYSHIFSDHILGIKWSLILITIISIVAFIIRLLARLYMSSLHLSRDAEEREQLTHFYLSLKKDTSIEPEERQLILQSLFSRADTGLLKEDSSPTMPGSFVDKFTSK